MPAGRGGHSAAGRGGPLAGSAAAISGRGRKTRALWSAPAGASPPASLSSTTLPPRDTNTRPDHGPASLVQIILALTASQRHPAAPSCRTTPCPEFPRRVPAGEILRTHGRGQPCAPRAASQRLRYVAV